MQTQPAGLLLKIGSVLVLLMAAIQMAYALYAYLDPASFALARGTALVDPGDSDWVRIYASRTLFISLVVGYLLYARQFKLLAAAALFGIAMPVTDAWLAYRALADDRIVLRHVATAVYLAVTFAVLMIATRQNQVA